MIRLDNRWLLSSSIVVLFSIFLLGSASAQPQPAARKMSLSECLTYASAHSITLANARIDEESSEAVLVENRAIGLPQINAGFDARYQPQVPFSAVPGGGPLGGEQGQTLLFRFQTRSSAMADISVSQLIFDGRYITALRAAKVYIELARKSTKRSQQEVIAGVSKAYYAVQVNTRRIELVQANREQLRKLVADTKAAAEQGLADNVDYQRTQVSLTNLETDLENAKAVLTLSENLLKFQMGMPVAEQLALSDSIQSNVTPAELEVGLSTDLDPNQRPEYQLLKVEQRLNQLDVQRYRVGYLPTLYGNYSIGTGTFADPFWNMFSNKTYWYATQAIGISLNIPIFDGLEKQAKIRQAKLKYEKSVRQEQELLNSFNLELANARTSFANALRTLESQKRNTDLANEVYRVAQVKYQQGVGSSLEVVQAESEYKAAQNNYINSLLDVLTARVDLKKALGSLGESSY